MILDTIVRVKKDQLSLKKQNIPEKKLDEHIEKSVFLDSRKKSFLKSIKRSKNTETLKIIAEVKKASPSKGIIRADFDYLQIANIYKKLSVNAISVLTEEQFFLGSLDYLENISRVDDMPALLRKDFIIEPYQVKESFLNGADAVLLIASILTEKELLKLMGLCTSFYLDYVLEVHNFEELKKALAVDPAIIGINNRNLKTFNVDLKTTETLLSKIPDNKIIVSESGIHTYNDALFLNNLGVDAVLIGEALMKKTDIAGSFNKIFSPLHRGVIR